MSGTAGKQVGASLRGVICALAALLALTACEGFGPFAGADPDAESAPAAESAALESQETGEAGPEGAEAPAVSDATGGTAPEVDAAEPENAPDGAEAEDEAVAPEAEAAPEPPDPNAAARAACERRGGFFSVTGGGKAGYCAKYTRDANRSCETSSACEGYCLARSRTCAPITPLIGCHQVLSDRGVEEKTCLN